MSTVIAETGNVAGELALDRLVPDHWPNPRGPVDTTSPAFAELKASIAEQGILEPIVIGPPLLELDGRHAIVAGWRRYTAATTLGLAGVPVHQRIDITDARQALRAALAENMAREQMTPLAEASAIARLVELGDTQVQAAAAVGVSERTARERLRLLDLPKPVRDGIAKGTVPTTCTRQLQLIADASPEAATAIAKKIAKGDVRALDVIDERRLNDVLYQLASEKVPLVRLTYSVRIADLGLSPGTARDLKARQKKASPYNAGEYLNFSSVGKKLLDEARAAGKLLEVKDRGGVELYIAGAEWIERAATAAVEQAERRGARDAAERKRQAAARDAAKDDDPIELARQEHAAAVAAIDDVARPHAAAMNSEIADRLAGFVSCPITGAVAQLVMHLVGERSANVPFLAAYGYKHIDPGRAKFPKDWAAGDPGRVAAELVGAYLAAAFCDPRADGKTSSADIYPYAIQELPEHLLRAIAAQHELLPARALRLADARRRAEERRKHHDGRMARRRILFELVNAAKAGLDHKALTAAANTYGRDAGDLVDVAIQVPSYGTYFETAIEQLLAAAHVKAAAGKGDGPTQYTVTAAGRKHLASAPGPAPLIENIDTDAAPPDIPEGAPATDELQRDDEEEEVVTVHVTPTAGGDPLEAQLQPGSPKGAKQQRQVRYTGSGKTAWVDPDRIVDLPVAVPA